VTLSAMTMLHYHHPNYQDRKSVEGELIAELFGML
jgi:hypothetical protein